MKNSNNELKDLSKVSSFESHQSVKYIGNQINSNSNIQLLMDQKTRKSLDPQVDESVEYCFYKDN